MFKHLLFFAIWYWSHVNYKIGILYEGLSSFFMYIGIYKLSITQHNYRQLVESSLLVIDSYFQITIFFEFILFLRVADYICQNGDYIKIIIYQFDVDTIKNIYNSYYPKKEKVKKRVKYNE